MSSSSIRDTYSYNIKAYIVPFEIFCFSVTKRTVISCLSGFDPTKIQNLCPDVLPNAISQFEPRSPPKAWLEILFSTNFKMYLQFVIINNTFSHKENITIKFVYNIFRITFSNVVSE